EWVTSEIVHTRGPRKNAGDAPEGEREKKTPAPPLGGGGKGFSPGIVARYPQVLRRMHNRQYASAVPGLRYLNLIDELQHRWQDEPEELGNKQRRRSDDHSPSASTH